MSNEKSWMIWIPRTLCRMAQQFAVQPAEELNGTNQKRGMAKTSPARAPSLALLSCASHAIAMTDSATNASATTSTRQNVADLVSADRAFHVQDVELVLAGAKGKFELIRLSRLDHTQFGSTLPSSGWGAASRRSKK